MPNPITSGVQPAIVANRSGFDKSFKNLLSALPGTLVPVLCDPVIPGTRVDLKAALRVTMPPLASDTFMNVKLKQEAFFVPASACYGGFNDFITKRKATIIDNGSYVNVSAILPFIDLNYTGGRDGNGQLLDWNDASVVDQPYDKGKLLDYLGFRYSRWDTADRDYLPKLNPLPLIAYHRIWDHFYRNALVTNPIFSRPGNGQKLPTPEYVGTYGCECTGRYTISQLPYISFYEGQETLATIQDLPDIPGSAGVNPGDDDIPAQISGILNEWFTYSPGASIMSNNPSILLRKNGVAVDNDFNLFHLWQRNFGADYFTTATPTPQKGDPSTVNFTVDNQGDGEISVAAFRAANAMQLFRERNNYVNDDIHAYNRAHYNVNKTGYGESLPIFIGKMDTDVYVNGVDQTAADATSTAQQPFKSVGTQYGRAQGNNEGQLIDGFEAPEFGYVMVLASLVPVATYDSGIDRHLLEMVNGDGVAAIPDALLQQVGPQEVFMYEGSADILGAVSPSSPDAWKTVFGYQQRFAHYMEKRDQVHGEFRNDGSLKSFAFKRLLTYPEISTEFLMIPYNILDGVSAVSGDVSKYGFWLDEYFDYRVSMPLAAYSIPSLENPAGSLEWLPKPGYTIK